MLPLSLVPGCRVERMRRDGFSGLTIAARSRRAAARCPECRHPSTAVHGYYRRRPADLPLLGRRVRLDLRVRRFACMTTSCRRRTFAEPLPRLVAPRAQRTGRLMRAQSRIGIAVGGAAGARLASHLGMGTSAATLLRLVRRTPLPVRSAPAVVGVDDWAMRKRKSYGTIIVDLERRQAVDLLPDRTAGTLAAWLRERPGITTVARDRSTEYARGITAGAPQAVQTADRWHLLSNARQMVERWTAGAHGRLRALPATAPVAGVRTRTFPPTRPEAALAADSRTRRLATYQDVRQRYLAGQTLAAIGWATHLAPSTVRKYAHAESFPERAVRAPEPSLLDPFIPHLEARLAEGCENAAEVWRELVGRGYAGTKSQVSRWLRTKRTQPARNTPHRWRQVAVRSDAAAKARALPSPTQLAWLITQAPDTLDPAEADVIATIEQDPEAAKVVDLVRRLGKLVRSCCLATKQRCTDPERAFERWAADASACGIRAVETFAAGLAQDGDAVRAALTLPWSSGQAEGQINKLKMLKRQMYGRAKLDLLRQRLILAA